MTHPCRDSETNAPLLAGVDESSPRTALYIGLTLPLLLVGAALTTGALAAIVTLVRAIAGGL